MGLHARLLALIGSALLATGCMNLSPAGTAFSSEPPGARVLVDGHDSGWVTPCLIDLGADEAHVVAISMAGYGTREFLLVPDKRGQVIPWYLGVNGVKSSSRVPILLPTWDLLLPFRTIDTLAPGRVFVRLRPGDAP